MYEATFCTDRLYGVLPNLWVECEGIRLESNLGFSFITDICRELKNAKKPDGPIAFFKNGYTKPSQTFPSIFEIADREPMVPQVKVALSDALYRALIQIDKGDWVGLHSRIRNLLLDRELVKIEGDVPQITELARRAMENYLLRPAKNSLREFPDITNASPEELEQAAILIGLNTKTNNIARTLALIERTVATNELLDVQCMARRAGVSLRTGGRGSNEMRQRRLLAAIINAGKIAEVL